MKLPSRAEPSPRLRPATPRSLQPPSPPETKTCLTPAKQARNPAAPCQPGVGRVQLGGGPGRAGVLFPVRVSCGFDLRAARRRRAGALRSGVRGRGLRPHTEPAAAAHWRGDTSARDHLRAAATVGHTMTDRDVPVHAAVCGQAAPRAGREHVIRESSMGVTAKETTRALRQIVYPLLKAEGFDDWTSRSAWRRKGGRIEHVEFRSFNTYYAERFDCTPASLTVWLGIQIRELSIDPYAKLGPKGVRLLECAMPIRAHLSPSLGLRQRNSVNIWNIDSSSDAEACASDIAMQMRAYGIAWLNRPFEPAALQGWLLQDGAEIDIEVMPNGAHLWIEAGNVDSPRRNRMLAELAKAQGDYALALERFERARWARNMKTGERYLYLSLEADSELQKLAQECARLV